MDTGVGLKARASVWLEGCSFCGYTIGAQAVENGWITNRSCVYENNEVGLQFDLFGFHYSDFTIYDCTFAENGTGIQLLQIPDPAPLIFDQTVFRDNEVDVDNPIHQTLEYHS